MGDYMAWADSTAYDMRDYYEANRPLRWWQKRTPPGSWGGIADNLMLGLLNIALVAERDRQGEAEMAETQTSPTPETGEDDLESRLRQVASCARYDNKTIFEAADRLKLYREALERVIATLDGSSEDLADFDVLLDRALAIAGRHRQNSLQSDADAL